MGRGIVVLRDFPGKHLCPETRLGRSTGCGRALGIYKKAKCRGEG